MKTRTLLTALALFAVFFAALAWVQFGTPDMPDNDGYYHIKLADIMRREGLKPAFPWLPQTVLNPREFYDHHFLFHVGLIPFTVGDLRLGAKWAAVLFAALALLSVWALLHAQGVPYAWLWGLGLLGISQAFLFRISITRAQSLSLLVLALGLQLMLSGRYRWLLALGFGYVWLYNAFPLLLATAGAYTVAVWLLERRLELRPLLYAGLGIGLGLLINPYFPHNLVFIYHHYLPKLTDATAVSVGNEWYPYDTQQLLANSTLAWLLLVGGAAALGMRGERWNVPTALAFMLSALFGLMLFQSRRFIEYFPPFVLIFAAFAIGPLWQRLEGRRNWLAALALATLVLAGSVQMLPVARRSVQGSKPYNFYQDASAWLENNTAPGELVFQTDWDDFPRLFFYNTHNTYLVGLDPTYLQLYDAELYDVWVEITQGEIARPGAIIQQRFGAGYVISDLLHDDFIAQAKMDPLMQEVYRDQQAVIFSIRAP